MARMEHDNEDKNPRKITADLGKALQGSNNFSKMMQEQDAARNAALAGIAKSFGVKNNPVSWMYERLMDYIAEFEAKLKPDQEVGGRLTSFGSDVTFHITNIGYHGPDMLAFDGFDNSGNPIQLLQHYTQMNVLLIALPKQEKEARRIGFRMEEKKNTD